MATSHPIRSERETGLNGKRVTVHYVLIASADTVLSAECGRWQKSLEWQSSAINTHQIKKAAKTAIPPDYRAQLEKELEEDEKFTRMHVYDGYTALMWAAMRVSIDAAQRLLDSGKADIGYKDGFTALNRASRKRHAAIVNQLLDTHKRLVRMSAKRDRSISTPK